MLMRNVVSSVATLSQLLSNISVAHLQCTTTSLSVFPTYSPRGPSCSPVCGLVPAWLYTSSGSEQPPGIPTQILTFPPPLLPWGHNRFIYHSLFGPCQKGKQPERGNIMNSLISLTRLLHLGSEHHRRGDTAQLSAFHGLDLQSARQNFISGNLSM